MPDAPMMIKCGACGAMIPHPPLQSHILQDAALAVVVIKPVIIECKCGKRYLPQLAKMGYDVRWVEFEPKTPSGVIIPPAGMKLPPTGN